MRLDECPLDSRYRTFEAQEIEIRSAWFGNCPLDGLTSVLKTLVVMLGGVEKNARTMFRGHPILKRIKIVRKALVGIYRSIPLGLCNIWMRSRRCLKQRYKLCCPLLRLLRLFFGHRRVE